MGDRSNQRSAALLAVVAVSTFALIGCGSELALTDECSSMASGEVFFGSWTSTSPGSAEGNALLLMEDEFHACNPGASVHTVEFEGKFEFLDVLGRILGVAPEPEPGAPPTQSASARYPLGSEPRVDVIHLNSGWDVRGLTPCGKDGPKRGLRPLSSVLDEETLNRPFAEHLLDVCDGELYALPIGTHRLNTLYVNTSLLEQGGSSEAELRLTSADDFVSLVRKLDAALVPSRAPSGTPPDGTSVESVLAIGTAEDWALSLFAFENVMVAHLGHDVYERFWKGKAAVSPKGLQEVEPLAELLDALAAYAPYLQPDAVSAQEALERVRQGRAVFTVIGDWHEKDLEDSDVLAIPFPGTQDVRIESADVFAIAENSPNPLGAAALLKAETTRRMAQAHVEAKGGAAARTDVAVPDEGVRPLPALPSFIPSEHFNDLGSKLSDWMRDVVSNRRSDDDFIAYVAEEYCALDEANDCHEKGCTWGTPGCPVPVAK